MSKFNNCFNDPRRLLTHMNQQLEVQIREYKFMCVYTEKRQAQCK